MRAKKRELEYSTVEDINESTKEKFTIYKRFRNVSKDLLPLANPLPPTKKRRILVLYDDLPPEIIRLILSFFTFPDLEYHSSVAAKMNTSYRFALSTTNHVLYKPKHLIKYLYGYFRNDEKREIFMLNPSMKITFSDIDQKNIRFIPYRHIIPTFGSLRKLTIVRASITHQDIQFLPQSLTYLSIMTTLSMDVSILQKIMTRLENLTALQFQAKLECQTEQLNELFHQLCRLKSLSILSTPIPNECAAIFFDPRSNKGHNMIEQLSLVSCSLSDACLVGIENNTTLKCLRIGRNEIGNRGAELISRCKSLQELSIDACNISGEGVDHVSKLPAIRRLWIRQNPVTMLNLSMSQHLQILNFHDNQGEISVQMCEAIAKCPSIHTLVMNKCRLVDDHIIALLKDNNTLKRLYINWNDNLTQVSIEQIAKNKSIYKLAYSQRTLTNDHLKYLLENNDTIQVLNIPFSPNVSDLFLPSLAKSKSLRTLKIRQVQNITLEGIEYIKKNCLSVSQIFYTGFKDEEHWIRPGADLSMLVE